MLPCMLTYSAPQGSSQTADCFLASGLVPPPEHHHNTYHPSHGFRNQESATMISVTEAAGTTIQTRVPDYRILWKVRVRHGAVGASNRRKRLCAPEGHTGYHDYLSALRVERAVGAIAVFKHKTLGCRALGQGSSMARAFMLRHFVLLRWLHVLQSRGLDPHTPMFTIAWG